MAKIERKDIQIISQHSNWSERGVNKMLIEEVYHKKKDWQQFLRLFFLGLGVCFTITGILFFFAYNWADLHKFIKIGLVEGLIVVTTSVVLFSKLKSDIKNILLTAASVLVGVLFAVFGQIYQTGANAYDFFWGWTMAIAIWVLISNFAPLWLVFLALVNTTLVLYSEQVAHDWSFVFIITLLFLINSIFFIGTLVGSTYMSGLKTPKWFSNVAALAAVSCSTVGICTGFFDNEGFSLIILLLLTALFYFGLLQYGQKIKNTFYFAIVSFSIIIIISALFVKLSDDGDAFFFISLFVIISVTLAINQLMGLQKKWNNE